jgi:outer membrane receptor protein involved in Fe transport
MGGGNIGPVGVKILAGYTYTWPGAQLGPDSAKYSTGQFIKDMFYYNFHRVEGEATSKILNAMVRHLVRTDIELSYWKCYVGTTFSYASDPEKIPGLFNAAAIFIFHNATALTDYSQQHIKGDFIVDIRAGFKINEHVRMGFICKNLTDRLYSLRPGKPEPTRNFTLQFRYTF